jgi:hypothetical protein
VDREINSRAVKPDATNTGPSNAGILVNSAGVTINTPGAVVENKNFTGMVFITANNVTLRNFRIDATGDSYGISAAQDKTGIVIEDGEIHDATGDGIYGTGYTARRINVHHCGGDGFKHQGDGAIQNCWVHDLGTAEGAHADGVQIMSGSNISITGNNFDMPIDVPGTSSNSAVFIRTAFGPIDNVTVDGNWMNGGNYTVYSVNYLGDIPTNVSITNNRFGRDYRYGILDLEGTVTLSGNVWDDTGLPIDGQNPVLLATAILAATSAANANAELTPSGSARTNLAAVPLLAAAARTSRSAAALLRSNALLSAATHITRPRKVCPSKLVAPRGRKPALLPGITVCNQIPRNNHSPEYSGAASYTTNP